MTTVYPGAIDTLANSENDAVNSIEQALGVNPQGTHASVVARLNAVDQRLAASERLFKVSEYSGIQAAIDAAFTAGGGIVILPWGVTTLPATLTNGRFITLKPGVSLMGFGAQSVLKVPDGIGNYYAIFEGTGLDNISLSDFVIDGNQTGNAPADVESFAPIRDGSNTIIGFSQSRYAFQVTGARIHFEGVTIRNLDCINQVYIAGANASVTDCIFEAAGTFEHDMSMLYTAGGNGARILRNRFVGNTIKRCAVETHTSDLYARENTILSCSTAFNVTGFVTDPLGTYAVTVKDNHILDCGAGVLVFSGAYGATPENQQVCDVVIADNIIRLNSTLWPGATVDKAVSYYQFNTKPVGAQIIRDNLVRVTA